MPLPTALGPLLPSPPSLFLSSSSPPLPPPLLPPPSSPLPLPFFRGRSAIVLGHSALLVEEEEVWGGVWGVAVEEEEHYARSLGLCTAGRPRIAPRNALCAFVEVMPTSLASLGILAHDAVPPPPDPSSISGIGPHHRREEKEEEEQEEVGHIVASGGPHLRYSIE